MARKTTKFYEGAAFLELQKEWYQKAADSGYEDIEADGEIVQSAEERNAMKVLRRNPAKAEALAEYFTAAERGLATLVFDSPTDRAIWAHHARGASVREIAELVDVSRQQVERRLAKYQKRLGLRRPR